MVERLQDFDPVETQEWLDSLDAVLEARGAARAQFLAERIVERAQQRGVPLRLGFTTPYVNTIPASEDPPYPGDRVLERRISSIIRWNAMAMVVRVNRKYPAVGGHIATFASIAKLYEVGFNHFFRGSIDKEVGDYVYFQGHSAPGIYARAYLEGRISEAQLENFRMELLPGGGLPSYPHPWLMPHFWEFPTVSMGLSPMMSVQQARFLRYLQHRGIADTSNTRVWCFLGDGEMDEPESAGAIYLAGREELDNLIWVVNCNLQRLDGPVRGNGKIIQELEALFRGAGWNVIKVIWGCDWDPLLAADKDGLLVRRMNEAVDGDYQKYAASDGAYIRQHFFGKYPPLLKLVEHLSDEQLPRLRRGGHDPVKVYAAYKRAVEHRGQPTVILAKTIKGYGLGEAGEARNIAHQQKKLEEQHLREFRDRFDLPIPDSKIPEVPFYHPGPKSPEVEYLLERRRALGGFLPRRVMRAAPLRAPSLELFQEFLKGSGAGREVSTTMAFVQMLNLLMRDKTIGKLIVPIVPDEARTFGMDALFRPFGIYSPKGQLYEPVDKGMLIYYREATDGQILEEGINEAGAMALFTAAGTTPALRGINTIPFYIFYSMFGFQRVGDFIWANADSRGKGFLMGATAGRTTLAGEGLQHQDGHSHVLASTVPNVQPYDPAFAFELAVIIQDGIRRMYELQEDIFYYITLYNERYEMPPIPDGEKVREGILRGLYKFRPAPRPSRRALRVHILASGPMVVEALRAQTMLDEQFHIQADVWSVTSFVLLRREALEIERWNWLHPEAPPRKPYITQLMEAEPWPVVAVSDYMKILPDGLAKWVPQGIFSLGTDGFGRSADRPMLRRFFEVDAESIVLAALYQLARAGKLETRRVTQAMKQLGLDPDKPNPAAC
ncbi:MAG: pyruvate dehydrogenase (acetyl-transferring), homodimeric type [Gemmatales bacterium]|nr:pyruvate dehydrogenase (acetyl-transferring), homodimeric type [Gemmatales bacterium]MDW7994809.1 pyruvate dehydrogenase (acetyl-transferring), homodimeric type [Gemmatales bacterium]